MTEQQTPTTPAVNARHRRVAIIYVLFLLPGLLSVLAMAFGVHFLPSLAWVEQVSVYGWIAGAVCAVLGLMLWLRGDNDQSQSAFGRVAMVVAAPLMLGAAGQGTVVAGIPFAWTLVAGAEGSLDYIVEAADGSGGRRCRTPVALADLPIVFREVCGVQDSFRAQLSPGMGIRVSGRSTWMGVFPATLSASEKP